MTDLTTTKRLSLREFDPSDTDFIIRLVNEPSFLEHIGDKGVRTLKDARNYLANGPIADYARHGYGLYKVLLRESGTPIGMCGLLKRDELEHPDVGYAFLPEFWSRGYAREAVHEVMRLASTRFDISKLQAIVGQSNTASIRLLIEAGFGDRKITSIRGEELILLTVDLSAIESWPC